LERHATILKRARARNNGLARAFVDSPANSSQFKGAHVVTDRIHSLGAAVKMEGDTATILVDLDGRRLLGWTGKPSPFSLHPAWRLRDDR
jgi:hypothetical protein